MPMQVRNNEPNVTTFAKTVGGDAIRIIWGTKGQHNDTQRVPDSFADDIDFLNALDQGVISVLDGPPEILAKISSATSGAATLRQEQIARQQQVSEGVMNRAQDRDMVGATCIGPGFRPGQTCGRPVLIASKDLSEVPPLCEEHEPLAMQFHLTESGSKGRAEDGASDSREGVVRREWKQAVITAPVRDLATS